MKINMNKVITKVSQISHNVFVGAVELNFTNYGSLFDYHESFKIALDMCSMHNLSNWIIEKDDFNDLSIEEYLMVINKWLRYNINSDKNIDAKVALVSKPQESIKLEKYLSLRWFVERLQLPSQVSLVVFRDAKAAYRFALSAKHLQHS
jgi:hypothetical protein